jgi:synaptic vesicle membrane protein VAT-1
MRQIWISKAGPPEVLVVKEALDPHPAAGELRIRVEASGVNFADIMGRLGLYPDLPRIPVVPGYEVAGRVDAVGAAVDASWVGQDVFASTRSAATPMWFACRRPKSSRDHQTCPLRRARRSQ